DHAERFAVGRDVEAGAGRFERTAMAAQRLAGEVAEDAGGAQRLADAFGAGLAFFAGEQLAEFVRAGEDRVGDLVEHVGAHFGRSVGPAGERVGRGLDRLVDFGRAAVREAGDDVFGVRRVAAFQRSIRAGPFAGDEVTESAGFHGKSPKSCR